MRAISVVRVITQEGEIGSAAARCSRFWAEAEEACEYSSVQVYAQGYSAVKDRGLRGGGLTVLVLFGNSGGGRGSDRRGGE